MYFSSREVWQNPVRKRKRSSCPGLYVQKHYPQIKVVNIALPDAYVEHGNVSVLRNELGIDSDSILAQLKREGVLETDAEA